MDLLSSPRVSAITTGDSTQPFASPKAALREPLSGFVTKVEADLTLQQVKEQHAREIELQRNRIAQIYSEKMREFEETCLSQYRSKVKELESTHISSAKVIELQAQLQVYEANESLLTKKWENKVIRLEKALEHSNFQLFAEKNRVAELNTELETKNYQLSTVLDQLNRLNSANEAKNTQETRTIEELTGNLKRVAMELAEEKIKNRQNPENCLKIRISDMRNQREELRKQVKQLENELLRTKEELIMLKGGLNVGNRKEYSDKVAEMSAEMEKWREKSVLLVTKMFPILKQLRKDTADLKHDAKLTQTRMQSELKSVLSSLKPSHSPVPSKRSTSQKRLPLCF